MNLTTGVNQLRLANALGVLLLMVLATFGVEFNADQQVALNTVIAAIGLGINQFIAEYSARKGTMLSEPQAEKAGVVTTKQEGRALTSALALVAAVALLSITALQGCANTLPTTPQSVNEAIADGLVAVEVTANAITTARNSGFLSIEKTVELKRQLQVAKDGIDAARLVLPDSTALASAKLKAANEILKSIDKSLKENKPK